MFTSGELERLVGAPKVTIYSWWQQGHIEPPLNPGSRSDQASFTLDEAFEFMVFSRIVRAAKRRREEGAVAARYLRARPGTFDLLRRWWTAETLLTVYPQYDLAAFNPPPYLTLRLREDAAGLLRANYGDNAANDLIEFWTQLRYISEPTLAQGVYSLSVASAVDLIFRRYKYFQRPSKSDIVYATTVSSDEALDMPWEMPLFERLMAESWAMSHIESGIAESAWTMTDPDPVQNHFVVNLRPIVDTLGRLAGEL